MIWYPTGENFMSPKTIRAVLAASLAASLGIAGFAAAAPQEDDADLFLVLDPNQRAQFRLAYPAADGAAGLSADAGAAAREFEETLRSDLEGSGIFLVQGPEQLAVLSLTGDQATDAQLYQSLGNELLLDTKISIEGERLVVEGRVTQLQGRRFVLGKRYRGSFSVARRMAHTFADEIIRHFTARPGLSLTSIAFSSDRDGSNRREIYVMDYDGWNQRPLTAHQTISLSPSWSPDQAYLAYVSYLDGDPGVYSVELKTGAKKPIITSSTLDISPSFSPDGRKIVFSRSVGRGNSEIFTCDRDGGNLEQLTRSSGIDTNPAWSPDGREIAFTSSRGGSPQIYVMSADGSNLRRVTFEGDYNDGADWDPKGTRLVHATRRGNRFDLAITDLVTLESKALKKSAGSHESPSFSPDGRKIVYASTRGGTTQVYVLDLAGGTETQLTRTGDNRNPSWSGFAQ